MAVDPREALLLHALQNSVKYGDVPKAGTVLGMVLGKHPELRPQAKDLGPLLAEVLAEVGGMSPDTRRAALGARAPQMVADLSVTHSHAKELPPLEDADGGVVMRFAPNPSGPLHLGHARAAVLNDAYVRKYGGRFVLRIEDTDPKRVDPAAYEMVVADIGWLGLGITETIYQSDRFDLYYTYCKALIEKGGAYLCTCDNERFRELRLKSIACPCRELPVEENLARWERMLAGDYGEGEISVRVRTDLSHPDPAIRDFPAFRVLKNPPHPRVEDSFVYPLMNFSVAVDDHLTGITHVIRGKDHIANTRRQRYIFDYLGWKVPVYRHYGRMGIEGVVLSTSQMREGIRTGEYSGWDDIRLGTLRALGRRGIQPEAVRRVVQEIGIGETDIQFSWDNLFAKNREIVDPSANRYFFVASPVRVEVNGAPGFEAHALLHPGDVGRGSRLLRFSGALVLPAHETGDLPRLVRCKDLFNVRLEGEDGAVTGTYAGDDLATARAAKAPIVQWLPDGDGVPCTLRTPGGDRKGLCERGVLSEAGHVIQFERVGFVRVDQAGPAGVTAYFTHR